MMKAPLQAQGPLAWLQHARREPNDPFDLLGDVLDGQFRVESFVGEGELSVVYKGHHLGVDAPVAIKCLNLPETLHPALARPLVQGFKEASRIHYRLARGNLHIAHAIASGSTLAPRTGQMVSYLVREWFDGEPLAAELGRRRSESRTGRPLDETFALLDTVFDAVSYAHGQGEVHLGLNPTNLFMARRANAPSGGTLKVLDFGMAGTITAFGSAGPASSAPTGLRLMLPAYAAPEQLERAVGRLGPWTDVYALALIMLEVLSDRMVMDTSETGALVDRALDERRRPTPQSHGLKLPPHVDRALARALARAPEARQGSAAELWRELGRSTTVVSLPWAGAPLPPRPSLPRPSLHVVPEASGPMVAEVASPVPPVPESERASDASELKTEVFRTAVRVPPVEAPVAVADSARADPLLSVKAWVEVLRQFATRVRGASTQLASRVRAVLTQFASRVLPALTQLASKVRASLPPFASRVRAVLVKKWAASLAACKRLLATRPKHAIIACAVFALLLLAALFWRRGSSGAHPIAASAAKPSVDPAPVPPPSPTPTQEPAQPAAAASASKPFNRDAALRALDRKWRDVAKCGRAKAAGKVSTTVTFGEDGSVREVVVAPPFAGTPTGQCIANTLGGVRVPPFDDSPAPVDYRVYVAPR